MCTIGTVYGDLLQRHGSAVTYEQKMSGRQAEGFVESGSVGSSRESTWRERRQKRCEDREREHEEEQSGLGKGSYEMNQIVSNAL